jgi:hypothetical protein
VRLVAVSFLLFFIQIAGIYDFAGDIPSLESEDEFATLHGWLLSHVGPSSSS